MKKRVLICEDNEGITDVMQLVLGEKYDLRTLSNGEQVEELITTWRPDILLLDLWMPGMNGEEVATAVKSNPDTKEIPIIIVSASRDAETVAQQVGADGALKKPFDITELEEVVESYIGS